MTTTTTPLIAVTPRVIATIRKAASWPLLCRAERAALLALADGLEGAREAWQRGELPAVPEPDAISAERARRLGDRQLS